MKTRPSTALLDACDLQLMGAVAKGLPLVSRPYAVLAESLGWNEREVVQRIEELKDLGLIKRFGVVVRHHELGYRANAMVVWDIPDDQLLRMGRFFGDYHFVTLCYQRPRRLPDWRYNLFTMIHGQNRDDVLERVEELVSSCLIPNIAHEVLFSGRRFKQRGALYQKQGPELDRVEAVSHERRGL